MLVSRGVLKHNVGEESQELLHLEVGWPLMRLQELRLHRGIDFKGDGRELDAMNEVLAAKILPDISTNM